LELASLADLAGAGDTGDTIGITTTFVSITTPMYPTAEFSPIATTSIAPADFMAAEREDSHHMPRAALIPERSAASIMEESQEVSLLAGSRASVEVSTVAAVSTAVEAGEDNSVN
jgi:hypothetical protein